MATLNKVLLMGNVTRAPDVRYSQGGMAVAEFTVAVNGSRPDDKAYFAPCVAFGKTAEAVEKYMTKGQPVLVEGKLQLEEWQDRESGLKRSKTQIIVNSVQFIGNANKTQGRGTSDQNSAYGKTAVGYVPEQKEEKPDFVCRAGPALDEIPF